MLDASGDPFYRWFPDGPLNTCYNAVDRHVEQRPRRAGGLIYDSPVTGRSARSPTPNCTTRSPASPAPCAALGVEKGDRVVIYMPMVPEAVVGHARLRAAGRGALGRVRRLRAERAGHADRRRRAVVISASCGIEVSRVIEYKPMLDRAIELAANKPERASFCSARRPPPRSASGDVDWNDAMAAADAGRCVSVAGDRSALHPLHVRHHRPAEGRRPRQRRHAVALPGAWANIYDIDPGDVCWAASDIGWVVGHSYIVYAPLFIGATTVLYEGKPVGTPDAGAFWRVISDHGVKSLFTAPTAFRAIKKEDPKGAQMSDYDISSLQVSVLGRRADRPRDVSLGQRPARVPVIDHWWQTETGWAIAANCMGIEPLPVKAGSPTVPVPGYDVKVLDEEGNEVPAGTEGAVAIRLPLPPGRCRPCGRTTSATSSSYLTRYPGLLRHRRRRLHRRGRLRLRDGPHRRRHQRRGPPALDRRDGGGHRRAPRRGRVRRHRCRRRAQGPGAPRLRRAQGRGRPGPRGRSAPNWYSGCATRSGRWPRFARSTSSRVCPRPGPGRSCGAPCAALPPGVTSPCPRPSTTRPSSTRCARCCGTRRSDPYGREVAR